MAVVRRRFFASPFLCARSETGDVSKDAPQSEAHLREYVVCLWFPTMWMVLTWGLIALNYAILQPACGWVVQISGHSVFFRPDIPDLRFLDKAISISFSLCCT